MAPGPTLVATASLETVAGWYEGVTRAEARLRFRANLEVGGTVPFWEDRLAAGAGPEGHFSIGGATCAGAPYASVRGTDARFEDGGSHPAFCPYLCPPARAAVTCLGAAAEFDHFYRLAINMQLITGHSATKRGPLILRVGDRVEVGGER